MSDKYQPLYLKYRPQSLADLVGQSAVSRTLANAIDHDRISHAYLFTGPRGTGKTSSARILAKSLNCQAGPTKEPCQTCASCEEIKLGISPAVFEIDAASNNSVDDARLLIERAPLVAQGGRFKLYIIDECHMLTKEAFNALLKTIEEPPAKVVFVLATTEEHKVPPTIVSRCQRLMFRLVKQAELAEHLQAIANQEGINIQEEALQLIARRSAGGLRDALGLLDQASLLATAEKPVSVADLLSLLGAVHEDALLNMSRAVLERDGSGALRLCNALLSEGKEPSVLVTELAKHFLNLAKASYLLASPRDHESIAALILGSPSYIEELKAQAQDLDQNAVSQIVEYLDELDQNLRRSTQPLLHLEAGLLSLCHRHEIASLKELQERIRGLESAIAGGVLPEPQKATASRPRAPQSAVQPAAKAEDFVSQTSAAPPTPAIAETARLEPVPVYSGQIDDTDSPAGNGDRESLTVSLVPADARSYAETGPSTSADFSTEESGSAEADRSENNYEMDEMWSELLDELQRRHLPTYSLVKTHAYPLAMSKEDLVIGVLVDNFQKMIESKANHLKQAANVVLGYPVGIKVRVAPRQNQPAPSKPRVATDKPAKKQEPDESDAEGDSAGLVEAQNKSEPQPEKQEGRSSLVQEAYKIFEGPGSRLIG